MSRPDEGLIHAWLDGELEPAEAERVKRLSETEPEWAAAVAEARGLIAASSRIVRALDAVPGGVIPSRTARAPMAVRGFRVRPWMGIAAGLVLVVGTAYVMRESTQEAFGPAAIPTSPTSPPSPSAVQTATTEATPPARPAPAQSTAAPAGTGERRAELAAPSEPSVGPARQLADDARRDAGGAGSTGTIGAVVSLPNQPAPVAIAPPSAAPALAPPPQVPTRTLAPSAPPSPAPAAAAKSSAEQDRALARARTSSDRLSQVVVTGVAERDPPASTLAGCWRATAPDSLVALYRELTIVRAAGDTLELRLSNTRTVLVVRVGDTLRGALTAAREVCPPRP